MADGQLRVTNDQLLFNMSKRILVIDDEPQIADLCRDYLVAAGFEVLTAGDGPKGLALARRERPDLVVLDLMLPGMDGLDVCRELRRDGSVPIIMLTARAWKRATSWWAWSWAPTTT